MSFGYLPSLFKSTEEPPLATFFKNIYDKTLSISGFWVRKKISQILPFKPEPIPLKKEDIIYKTTAEKPKTAFDKYDDFKDLYSNTFSWSEKIYFSVFGKQQKELLNTLFETYKAESKQMYNRPGSYNVISVMTQTGSFRQRILPSESIAKKPEKEENEVQVSIPNTFVNANICATKFLRFFGVNIDKEASNYASQAQAFISAVTKPAPRQLV